MKKLLACCILLGGMCSAFAQTSVMRGEVSAGVYTNVSVNSSGQLQTVGVATGTTIIPYKGTVTNRSGTITTGGTSQQIMAANASRRYLMIQNVSDTVMWCNFTTAAVLDQPSFQLVPGATFLMEASSVSTEAIQCIGSVTGKSFTAKEM